MEAKKEDIKIYGKLVNVTTENVVADAQQIWDSNFQENQQNVNKSIRSDFNSFKKNPQFENATFIGNSTFNGNVKVNENFSVDGESDFNGVIKAHGIPNSIIADHKITTNDLEVMGTFKALNLDTNNLTVHGLLKVENEGELRIDGDSVFNNATINGNFNAPHATTQKFGIVRLAESMDDVDGTDVVTVSILKTLSENILPEGNEGDILVFKNGKWVAGDALQQINNNVNQTITNLTEEVNNLKQDLTNQFNQLKQELLNSQYWELNSNNEVTPKESRSVKANHFYKSESN